MGATVKLKDLGCVRAFFTEVEEAMAFKLAKY